MIARRTALATLLFAFSALPSAAQVPPAQQDGGMGGASSAGGSSGGGMTADDEQAQGVEAGHEGRPIPDPEKREEGLEAVEVDPSTDARSPASGGVPNPPAPAPATR
ncbi:MAG: hypothetical protein Q8S29_18215 [Phreatobacter sp.]|nr:hypothetical protein [Phreatobacter sp.]